MMRITSQICRMLLSNENMVGAMSNTNYTGYLNTDITILYLKFISIQLQELLSGDVLGAEFRYILLQIQAH